MSNISRKQLRSFRLAPAATVALAIVFGMSGCSLFPHEDEPIVPPFAKPVAAKIRTVEAIRGDIVKRELGSGYFEPIMYAPHQFTEAGGRIEKVFVKSGDVVKKGDILIQLDMEGLDIEVLQRQLEVEKKTLAFKEATISGNADQIRIAKLELQLAKLLYDKVKSRVDGRQLRSELDGSLTFVDKIEPGDYVDKYRKLVIVADPKKLRLAYTVTNSTNLNSIFVGMKAEVELANKTYSGTVVQTPANAPSTDNEQLRKQYQSAIYIEMDKMDELAEGIKMGSTAGIKIVLAEKKNAVIIPRSALRKHFDRTYVQLLDGESRREIDVEVGLETPTEVEILKGLEAGQLVILP